MSNPWIGVTVCTGLAAAIIAVIGGLAWAVKATLYDARGDHTAAGVEAAKEAHRKLDGLRPYTGVLLEDRREPPALPPGNPPWDFAAPVTLTGPHRALRYAGGLTDDEVARIREHIIAAVAPRRPVPLPAGTGELPMLPPDPPPAGQLGPPGDPYTTGEMPALLASGHVTPAEHAGWLAGKYLTTPEATQ